MDIKADSLGIPFGKFQIDPAIIAELVLKKHKEFDDFEPEELFLFEQPSTGDYYCVYAPADYNGTHHEDIARECMAKFVEAKEIEFVKSKHDDFYPTHYLARIVMSNNGVQTELTQEELSKIELGEPLNKDYFYIPIITYTEQTEDWDELWYSLRFNDEKPPLSLVSYASKVPVGKTLWQAVRQDLEKDFNYPHDVSFVIESAQYYDTAQNKHGDSLSRVAVELSVNTKFDVTAVHPLGLNLHWQEEGLFFYNPVWSYFESIKLSDEYLQLCRKVVDSYEAGKLTMHIAAGKLSNVANDLGEYPFEATAHPMLRKIADLAFDISEDYRSDEADAADWEALVATLHRYEHGDWDSTIWVLQANYGAYEDGRLAHSYSVAISRQNGVLTIEAGSPELKEVLDGALANLNPAQTDERYLQNVLKVLPNKVGELRFTDADMGEYLADPYYATHG